jgi:selenocysteine-specific elongation factor
VSATSNQGIGELEQALYRLEPVRERRCGITHPYLPVDRVFAMKGFGAVVTGTLRGGELTTRTSVELLPRKMDVSIRAMQVHNQVVERAAAGQRVAVNLRHIKLDDIRRGDVLVSRGQVESTRCIDVELKLLDSCEDSLHNAATVRFLAGTTESMAKVRLLNLDRLEPGGSAFAQLLFRYDVTTYRTERFVIRSYSPMRTIGGGTVLDPHAERHRRFDRVVVDRLATAAHGDPSEKLRMLIAGASLAGTSIRELGKLLAMHTDEVEELLAGIETTRVGDRRLVDPSAYAGLIEAIVTSLECYHDTHPSHYGVAAAKLRSNLAVDPAEDIFRLAVGQLVSETRIEIHGGNLRLAGFDPLAALTKREQRLAAELEDAFRSRRLAPTYRDQVVGHDRTRRDLFDLLCDSDRLVRLKTHGPSDDFVVHIDIFDKAVADIETHFAYPQKFTVSEVRNLLGANRKFTVPFMEYLDATGVTIRMGNLRQLRTQ